ncbi:hypothetical protein M885DRAFT_542400 [Pelagophyceae sp. CCMP2097]|nr:hypothetical protein M885DRAFT_542400 [Pelagophyceae sp. CCMP2097]|mmetsp:Transcript_22490/g.80258  ORF Transcript_22490/g.80258 Transcript_22490/m.80258 type:complete len:363 (-) Transcript_22490:50-1138(-)
MDGAALSAMLGAAMPTVKCVLVDAAGSASEVSVDMTPQANAPAKVLGGAVTFLGEWAPLQVFVLVRREDEAEAEELPVSNAQLPKPFDAAEFRGPCLMTRSDDDALPRDFTLAEYVAFKAKPAEAWQELDDDSEDGEEEDEEDDDDDEGAEGEEEDDGDEAYDSDAAADDEALASVGDAAAFKGLLLASALEALEKQHGRAPTAAEVAQVEAAIEAKLSGEGDDAAARGEAIILEKICAAFLAKNGRAPTPAEVDETLDRLRALDDDDDDDENVPRDANVPASDEEGDDEEGDDNAADDAADDGDVMQQLVGMFRENNGRDPTEAEMQQWAETLKDASLRFDEQEADAAPDDEPAPKKPKTG